MNLHEKKNKVDISVSNFVAQHNILHRMMPLLSIARSPSHPTSNDSFASTASSLTNPTTSKSVNTSTPVTMLSQKPEEPVRSTLNALALSILSQRASHISLPPA